jgi:hypothetical protein
LSTTLLTKLRVYINRVLFIIVLSNIILQTDY